MEKIWIKNYEPGVRGEIDVCQHQSIPDVFWESVEKYGHRKGYTSMGVVHSYRETGEYVRQFTAFLQNHLKLEKGERIALMMPNILQYPVALFGALSAGLVVVNVNPLYTPRELEHQLKDSGATTIVVLENFANTLELVLERTPVKNVIITSMGDLLGSLKGFLVNFAVRHIKKMVPNYQIAHAIPFKKALAIGAKQQCKPVNITLEDLAFLQYTGGTTGISKGAMLTHGNICANMAQAKEWTKNILKDGEEIVLTPLPLYHIFSLTINLMLFTQIGGQSILIANPRDISGFIKDIKRYPVTVMVGLNTLFNGLLHNEAFKTVDFSTWKLTLSGGMAPQKAVVDQWQKVTGLMVINAYGLTEASPGVCVSPLTTKEFIDSIGYPIPNTDIEIRDANGQVVEQGQEGELWVHGPQVMRGYWNKPEETAKSLDDRGFLATGDIVVMNEDGSITIKDRKKDMIVVSGFNVYPNEVEDVVASHPGVLEVACVGVPSEKTGEALKLFVVKRDPQLSEKDIIAFCREQLTNYKVPKIIEFRDELPKSNVGKILRRELRDQ